MSASICIQYLVFLAAGATKAQAVDAPMKLTTTGRSAILRQSHIDNVLAKSKHSASKAAKAKAGGSPCMPEQFSCMIIGLTVCGGGGVPKLEYRFWMAHRGNHWK